MSDPPADWTMAFSADSDFEPYGLQRTRSLNKKPIATKDTSYVLCWLQQTLRGVNNPVIDVAITLARQLNQPVLVYHGLGQHYPHASDRLHRFILQASISLEEDLARRGVRLVRYVETNSQPHKGVFYQLAKQASLVVVDDQSAFVGRWQAQRVAGKLDRQVVAVDGARLVPEHALDGALKTTRAFRAAHGALRKFWLQEPANLTIDLTWDAEVPEHNTTIEHLQGDGIDDLIARCDINHSVPPVSWCEGTRQSALNRLQRAVAEQVPRYASDRNNPCIRGTTYLSPHLHFGVLGPAEVACAVMDADVGSRDRWKYLDELLTWREYFHHQALNVSDPTAYTNLPKRAQATLANHAKDERETLYSLDQLIHGDTEDDLWNAAQRQFLRDGWMYNNLRMYWGKQIIGWTPSPEAAWQTACYLNDRFSLDGRDPATYGNLQWCFGASKPAAEAPVYGTVPRKSPRALMAKAGMKAWVAVAMEKDIPRVAVPAAPFIRQTPQASGATARLNAHRETADLQKANTPKADVPNTDMPNADTPAPANTSRP